MCIRKDRMLKKLDRLAELKKELTTLEAEIEEIETSVKEAMTKENTEEAIVGGYKITYKTITQRRFDSKAFQKDHKNLYEEYKKTSSYKKLTIS